jgi:nitrous oxidase accessory protein NosD
VLSPGVANAWPSRVYVSPHGWSHGADVSCATAGYASINAALKAVATHGTVIVCRGTYRTQAVVTRPVRLIGEHAVINAKGQKPVIKKLPGGSGIVVLHTRDVHVKGFTVVHAGFDGILVALSRRVLVAHNVLEHNGDVGVDFNGTSRSRASRNVSKFNHGGGFLVADDIGPTRHDTISWNVASHNPGGCGVILAGHSTFGVTHNRVAHNWLVANGTRRKTPGAGVVIATEVPGERVADNTVTKNWIYRNGNSGVTLHSHVAGQHLSGNRITGNWIGRNNVLGDSIGLGHPVTNVPDPHPTGILIGAASRVRVTIRHNHISHNWYGIFLEGRVTAHLHHNHFRHVRVRVKVVA